VRKLAESIGESIPLACQDWANTKAAYRFLANEKVSEQTILAGHFQSTRERFSATEHEPILILHDSVRKGAHLFRHTLATDLLRE
jgi:hypothetical protein